VERRHIFLNFRETSDWLIKTIITLVVVYQRHLSDQDYSLAPTLVVTALFEADAFPGCEPEYIAGINRAPQPIH
jgi:hypothetical protein